MLLSEIPLIIILILIFTIVEYAPEIYRSHVSGIREARRWASILASEEQMHVEYPFEDRWEVGNRDVRLVSTICETTGGDPSFAPWVGTHWTVDGYPDPEAIVLGNREAAYRWVLEPPGSSNPRDVDDDEWTISAAFGSPANPSYSVAHLGKVFLWPESVPSADVDYEVEVTGTFVQSIRGSVCGPPGLGRRAIERRIEENWAELSAAPDFLLESSWELDSFHEL